MVDTRMARPNLPAGFDVTDPDMYVQRIPVEEFAELRRTAPIWWQEKSPEVGGFQDDGFWVVSKHADVKEVSRRSDVFSTFENTALPRFNDDIEREQIELQRFILLNMDPPEHTRMRKIISRGFTPARSTRCGTSCRSGPKPSSRPPPRPGPAISSPRSPANCPCRRSPN